MHPIFIGWTRSFWFTVGGLLMLLEGGIPVIRGFLTLLHLFYPFDIELVTAWVAQVSPAVLWLAALNERRGSNRPYSINPKDK